VYSNIFLNFLYSSTHKDYKEEKDLVNNDSEKSSNINKNNPFQGENRLKNLLDKTPTNDEVESFFKAERAKHKKKTQKDVKKVSAQKTEQKNESVNVAKNKKTPNVKEKKLTKKELEEIEKNKKEERKKKYEEIQKQIKERKINKILCDIKKTEN